MKISYKEAMIRLVETKLRSFGYRCIDRDTVKFSGDEMPYGLDFTVSCVSSEGSFPENSRIVTGYFSFVLDEVRIYGDECTYNQAFIDWCYALTD